MRFHHLVELLLSAAVAVIGVRVETAHQLCIAPPDLASDLRVIR